MLTLRLVGACFLALALYVSYESVYGALAGISNINANIAAMARVLDAQNKQSTCGLYNDDLGY